MANNIYRSLRSPRLNPFAFPSDTDFRFVLLIFSVLGATSLIYNVLSTNSLSSQTTAALHCNAPFQARTYRDIEAIFDAQQRYIQCTAPYLHLLIAWLIGGIALVLIVAFVFYWIFPTWKLWREKLVPLSVEDAPEVVAYLEELCHEVGLVPPPRFVWNPLNQANGALAFGRFRQYYVALSGGLVTQFYTDQPAFRAVLLHELAHLRNADVNETYFAVALWRAFVVVALIPFAVYLVVQAPFSTILMFNLVFRVLVLAVLVYLTRNAVLRAREVYADVRASTWDGVSGALSRVLAALPHARGHWQALARVHPSPDERCRVLNDTGELFLLSFWEAFGVGIATGVAIPNVQTLLEWLFYSQQVDFRVIVMPNLLGTALIFTPLVGALSGIRHHSWHVSVPSNRFCRVLFHSPDRPVRLQLALECSAPGRSLLLFQVDCGRSNGLARDGSNNPCTSSDLHRGPDDCRCDIGSVVSTALSIQRLHHVDSTVFPFASRYCINYSLCRGASTTDHTPDRDRPLGVPIGDLVLARSGNSLGRIKLGVHGRITPAGNIAAPEPPPSRSRINSWLDRWAHFLCHSTYRPHWLAPEYAVGGH